MRIGLIGVGRSGAFHAQTLTDLAAVDELIITDAVPDLARRLGERLGVRVAPDPADVLAAGIDGVVIASSTASRALLGGPGIVLLRRDLLVHPCGDDHLGGHDKPRDIMRAGSIPPDSAYCLYSSGTRTVERDTLHDRIAGAGVGDVVGAARPSPRARRTVRLRR